MRAMMLTLALAALGFAQVRAANLAVVRVFSTDEEVMLLNSSSDLWATSNAMPCAGKSTTSEIDLILVYSKDLATDVMASQVVAELETTFMNNASAWVQCFRSIKNMSAKLNPEQDVYDSNGYTTNKHWVSGPNTVFKSIMDAMMTGPYMGMYDSFFLMEMDAVPIKANWLDQFETEALEMPGGNMAVRGSQYLGDKWDLFKHMMPDYLVDHINGNAIYNLKNNWTQYLVNAFTAQGTTAMLEEMAFDVAFAMITMAAESGSDPTFSAAWTNVMGSNTTYNPTSMLVGNYANTLLNTSYEFPTYIRHGSNKNLFENLPDDNVTLVVAWFDYQGHFLETVPTHHPFKKIMGLAYYEQSMNSREIPAPDGNVTLTMKPAKSQPYYHLCEAAKSVDTKWFALTDNYHIVKAPVSVLMETMDKPVLPYVLKDSRYCGERPNCKASMEQAEDLFGIVLNYHHDKYEVLYKTADALAFCDAWDVATTGKDWGNCSLAFGPTADDYIAWKISSPTFNVSDEFTPKDKTRYGWRAWTSLWNPAPVDDRNCETTLYGIKEYLETLGNISTCAVDYVENETACVGDSTCMWKPMFQSGVCMLDPKSITTTTTVEGAVFNVIEVTMPMTVDNASEIINDVTVTTAMRCVAQFSSNGCGAVNDHASCIALQRRCSDHFDPQRGCKFMSA
ncbi:unnamed protein product [Symbiodinium sp. CCMP2456]|nr:unnamed protein product [Symbiodinium sp. CCMP2456]